MKTACFLLLSFFAQSSQLGDIPDDHTIWKKDNVEDAMVLHAPLNRGSRLERSGRILREVDEMMYRIQNGGGRSAGSLAQMTSRVERDVGVFQEERPKRHHLEQSSGYSEKMVMREDDESESGAGAAGSRVKRDFKESMGGMGHRVKRGRILREAEVSHLETSEKTISDGAGAVHHEESEKTLSRPTRDFKESMGGMRHRVRREGRAGREAEVSHQEKSEKTVTDGAGAVQHEESEKTISRPTRGETEVSHQEKSEALLGGLGHRVRRAGRAGREAEINLQSEGAGATHHKESGKTLSRQVRDFKESMGGMGHRVKRGRAGRDAEVSHQEKSEKTISDGAGAVQHEESEKTISRPTRDFKESMGGMGHRVKRGRAGREAEVSHLETSEKTVSDGAGATLHGESENTISRPVRDFKESMGGMGHRVKRGRAGREAEIKLQKESESTLERKERDTNPMDGQRVERHANEDSGRQLRTRIPACCPWIGELELNTSCTKDLCLDGSGVGANRVALSGLWRHVSNSRSSPAASRACILARTEEKWPEFVDAHDDGTVGHVEEHVEEEEWEKKLESFFVFHQLALFRDVAAGSWRFDLLVMVLYQMTLFCSVQLLFVIFLDYMPSTYCNDSDYCYKVKKPCLANYDPTKPNICPVNSTDFDVCVREHKTLQFHSAQFDYQHGCQPFFDFFSAATSQFSGMLFGNIILGYASDRLGRRKILLLSMLVGIPCLVLSAAIPTLWAFYTFRIINGFTIAGTLTVGWSYGSEMISPRQRLRLRAIPNWANARLMMTGLAWLAGEWRLTTFLCAGVSCITIPIVWYLPESPTFLRQKGRFQESEDARERIATLTGEEFKPGNIEEVKKLRNITIKNIFTEPVLRKRFLILCYMWFFVGTVLYVTDLNGAGMYKNFWVGQFLTGLILTIAKIAIGLLDPYLPWLGRRILFMGTQIIALVCYCFIIYFLYTDQKGTYAYLAVYVLAFGAQSLTLETCYLSLAELMPTDVRSTAGALTNFLMKSGSVIAALVQPMKNVHEPALYWFNLCLAVPGVILVFFFLDESRGCNLELVGQAGEEIVSASKSSFSLRPSAKSDERSIISESTSQKENSSMSTKASTQTDA
ncbi:unnamed protein product [Caenorhabditis auriculariae]|uniref:Major facilitator superfamily (MFS) profile domain-containing protein n=1 Tax=Caenorhabditis auriculariae TaxID=2777116 RepID=A0A8S1H5S1_9PELO|nr:unnamed protein product [Caenorhabditis auriculariae]